VSRGTRFLVFIIVFFWIIKTSAQELDSSAVINLRICTSDSNKILNDVALMRFFQTLDSLKTHQKHKLNILHIGDSHIQGDYMSRTIRYRMQAEFGEGGRGMVFPYAFLNMYGPVDYKCISNVPWENSRIFPKEKKYPVGFVGYTVATDNINLHATIELTGSPLHNWGSLDNFSLMPDNLFDRVKVVYSNDSLDMPLMISPLSTNQLIKQYHPLPQFSQGVSTGFQIQTLDFDGLYNKIEIVGDTSRKSSESVQLHGLIFENSKRDGIVYHMAGVGACQLDNFLRSTYFVSQTIALKPELIIISLGANESVTNGLDTAVYVRKYIDLIGDLKREIPGVAILLTTPPDILYRGKLPVMKKPVQRAIFKIANETNCAWWDLGQIMGGDYSNHIWFLAKYAGPDKIHFSPKGYDFQGLLFMEALLRSYNQYCKTPIDTTAIKKDLSVYRKMLNEIYAQELKKIDERKGKSAVVTHVQQSDVIPVKGKPKMHVVARGESVYSISRKYGLDYHVVLRLNGLTESSLIRPGQKIKLR
jgi:hypothetical protein